VEFGYLGKILWGYMWVAGRYSKSHNKRYITEAENKLNNKLIDKLLIQMFLLVLYILVNAIIFTVISLLREDPL
jgi:hypothetical protein